MIVIDANILFGLFDAGDALHDKVVRLLDKYADDQWEASVLTLAEFYVHPARSNDLARAERFITDLGITSVPLLSAEAAPLARVRADSGLKLPDAVVLWLAQSSSATLMTLDDRLGKAAARLGVPIAQ